MRMTYGPADVISIDVIGARNIRVAVSQSNQCLIKGEDILVAIFVKVVGFGSFKPAPQFSLE